MVERLIDVAAGELGLAPDEIRRRNFVSLEAMPYRTALNLVYDSGEFARTMDDALARADWRGFEARRAAADGRGKQAGRGLAYYVETCAGQVHGGIAQGVGQALLEWARYDEESGQLLAGSFLDYCMPRADDLPDYDIGWNEIPCRTNPMGIKSAAEAGAVGAPPAVISAVVDALSEFGVRHVDMPATPERIWRAMESGSG